MSNSLGNGPFDGQEVSGSQPIDDTGSGQVIVVGETETPDTDIDEILERNLEIVPNLLELTSEPQTDCEDLDYNDGILGDQALTASGVVCGEDRELQRDLCDGNILIEQTVVDSDDNLAKTGERNQGI